MSSGSRASGCGFKKIHRTWELKLETDNLNPGPLESLFRVLDDGDRFDFYLRISR
jgi:hypothetical protein